MSHPLYYPSCFHRLTVSGGEGGREEEEEEEGGMDGWMDGWMEGGGRKEKRFTVTRSLLSFSRALPFVLDSDEEVMTTRFELSKMN